jgi:hypothetical protein
LAISASEGARKLSQFVANPMGVTLSNISVFGISENRPAASTFRVSRLAGNNGAAARQSQLFSAINAVRMIYL